MVEDLTDGQDVFKEEMAVEFEGFERKHDNCKIMFNQAMAVIGARSQSRI